MGYIYKFLDYDNNIIYIGKTGNLERRMQQHFFNGHLDKSCYENVNKIFFFKVDGKTNTDIMETFLINKYHPKYNEEKQFNEILELHENEFLDYEEPEWERLYFEFNENKILLYKNVVKPKYYDRNLTYSDKAKILIKSNIYQMQYRKGLYYHCLKKKINDIKEFLDYMIMLHYEILNNNNINISDCNLDEPISYETAEDYIAFDINKIKTINIKFILLGLILGLIIPLNENLYGLMFQNEYTLYKNSQNK